MCNLKIIKIINTAPRICQIRDLNVYKTKFSHSVYLLPLVYYYEVYILEVEKLVELTFATLQKESGMRQFRDALSFLPALL